MKTLIQISTEYGEFDDYHYDFVLTGEILDVDEETEPFTTGLVKFEGMHGVTEVEELGIYYLDGAIWVNPEDF